MLLDGDLTAGHARAILNSSDPQKLAKIVCSRGLNVRQTEKLCKALDVKSKGFQRKGAGLSQEKPADTLVLERNISNILGVRISLVSVGSRRNQTIHLLEH